MGAVVQNNNLRGCGFILKQKEICFAQKGAVFSKESKYEANVKQLMRETSTLVGLLEVREREISTTKHRPLMFLRKTSHFGSWF